jgi:phosphoribosyl-AMP cyclohydrolase
VIIRPVPLRGQGTPMSPAAPTTYPQTAIDKMIAAIEFNDQGLVAAIAQQHGTGEVLMMAWMDRNAVAETMRSGRVCYWSRSRQAPWRKGDTSGHIQQLVDLRVDCDGDTLLVEVEQTGVACHTGRHNCFFRAIRNDELEIIAPVEVDMSTVGKESD